MSRPSELRFEVATGLSLGARDAQEDSVLCDVPKGGGAGILLLADGLGGHAGGALASRIAVTTALRELLSHRDADGRLTGELPQLLHTAVDAANHAVLAQAECAPDLEGMGTTLILAVVQDDALHWISVGDSPLYLLRDGALSKLNETHSLAPHLDLLVEVGEMDAEEAAEHPGRNCLTSALGTEKIERIDCPEKPHRLHAGDALLAASDGILTLQPAEIAETLLDIPDGTAPGLGVERLLGAVDRAGADEQDNTSIALLHVEAVGAAWPAITPPTAFLDRVRARLGFGELAAAASSIPESHSPASTSAKAQ